MVEEARRLRMMAWDMKMMAKYWKKSNHLVVYRVWQGARTCRIPIVYNQLKYVQMYTLYTHW